MIIGNLRAAGRKKWPPKKNFASLGNASPKSMETKRKEDEVITAMIKNRKGDLDGPSIHWYISLQHLGTGALRRHKGKENIKHSKAPLIFILITEMFLKDQRFPNFFVAGRFPALTPAHMKEHPSRCRDPENPALVSTRPEHLAQDD